MNIKYVLSYYLDKHFIPYQQIYGRPSWAALGLRGASVGTNWSTLAFLGRSWPVPRLYLDFTLPGINFGPPMDNSGALLVPYLDNFSCEVR